MINMRSANRIRVTALLVLTAALALGSFWILEVVRRSAGPDTAADNRNVPDYYVENFQFVRVSNAGQVQYSMSGERLTHYPADDTHKVEQPVVKSLAPERPPMHAVSKMATVDRVNGKIHMYDDVHLDRAATADKERLQLDSEYLLLLTDEEIMRTDRPVTITMGQSVLKGTGMVANNATGELRLASNVHVTYRPPSKTTGRQAQ